MIMFPPIPLIRRNHIVNKLRKSSAFTPETSVTLADAGVINPSCFKRVTERLIKSGVIAPFENGRFYLLDKK